MQPTLPGRLLVLAVVCMLLQVSTAIAQKTIDAAPSIKFGKITVDQFTSPSVDSTAEAVVLYDLGEVNIDVVSNELWLEFTRHTRLLIRRKSAYPRATVQVSTRRGRNGQHEFLGSVEGYTYNLVNGDLAITKLTKDGQFSEKASEDVWLEKFTLPNVREGSIIEYKYTIRTPFSVNYNPRTWRFQQDIPVNWSEYRIVIPNYFYYKMILGGYLPLAVNEKKNQTVALFTGQPSANAIAYRFAVKDAPAFQDESYITTDDDYLSKIDFELASYLLPGRGLHDLSISWEALDQTLVDHPKFGGQYKRAGFLQETAQRLLSQHTDTLSRVTAAYDFVRQSIKWDEQPGVLSENIKRVFDAKKGDAADINLLLVALLREMNIEANPVVLSTRSHGRVHEAFALLRMFNYVVAHVTVGGKDLLLDATDPYLKPGMLPLHCLNGIGRLVRPKLGRLVSLAPIHSDIESKSATLTINADGDMTGTITHSHSGYSAWSAQKKFATEGRTKYLDAEQKKRPAWQVNQVEVAGAERQSTIFNVTYTVAIPEACSRVGDRLYFKPMITESRLENPFKDPKRLFPVDFGVMIDETFSATYTLPDGYEVDELPKMINVKLPNNEGRFLYSVGLNGRQLQLVSRVSLRKPLYFAEEYPYLRELFSQIVVKHAEQVVLKRVSLAEKKEP
ncbi:DUF3857 domain-containing protein [Fibrisoma montanum]|uniref:DUF3857 domain-containing protein n=1 Tax=Fibrisoma montanum TaxID=2305895 RepID=A0A418MHP8_9BACT|nr:transglutaminase domain-containing protein [Fibrisoma montanum]RIV26950.1 DUF3857 domain-containing protein [Fibrisoma montanum]